MDIILGNTYKLIDNIEHQGIGGQNIIIEKELIYDDVFEMGTIGAMNFIHRRPDLFAKGILNDEQIKDIRQGKYTLEEFNKTWEEFFDNFKIYYGHIGGLGYFVGEDEIVGEVK